MENTVPEPKKTDPEPKIIGLTGGIGSGKTTVAQYIEELGYSVYYSDLRAKEIVNENASLKAQIKAILGDEAYDNQGLYNRKYIAELVFNDAELLQKLNETIHPAVKYDFEHWVSQQHSEYLFKETALLFELKLHQNCYKTILVTAEDNLRTKRVMDRDGKTYREIEAIMDKQMPEKDKIKKADFVTYNNSDIETLKRETLKTINELVSQ